MHGSITKIGVGEGDVINSGEILLTMEAMKMLHDVKAPRKGRVSKIIIKKGAQVSSGDLLLTIADK